MSTDRRAGPDRRRAARGGRRATDPSGHFPNVLVAESYDGARLPCVRYLDRLGFQVDQAVDAAQVRERIARTPPHIVLLESGLPRAPLPDVVDAILNLSERRVPILILSNDPDAVADATARLPSVALLPKPFSLATMVEAVRRLLRERPPVSGGDLKGASPDGISVSADF